MFQFFHERIIQVGKELNLDSFSGLMYAEQAAGPPACLKVILQKEQILQVLLPGFNQA